MTQDESLEAVVRAVDLALELGAQGAEASLSRTQRFHVEARDTTISKLEQSTGSGVHLRLWSDRRRASVVSTDLHPDALRAAIARGLDQLRYVAQDPYAGLPEDCGVYAGDLVLVDASIAAVMTRRRSRMRLRSNAQFAQPIHASSTRAVRTMRTVRARSRLQTRGDFAEPTPPRARRVQLRRSRRRTVRSAPDTTAPPAASCAISRRVAWSQVSLRDEPSRCSARANHRQCVPPSSSSAT